MELFRNGQRPILEAHNRQETPLFAKSIGIGLPQAHASGRRDYLFTGRHPRVLDRGQAPGEVKPGDVLFVPAGTVHLGKNVGSDNEAELATYVVEKGKPLITLVK